ncbi:hypothetical protein [Streptomyces sp. KMM 9044]|nr:hypothetical protein [Streptomyces sp. KMM 9044]WAX82218.1 hypothetical protein HUV60_033260 [Streptomyces sp. KMM 9044]
MNAYENVLAAGARSKALTVHRKLPSAGLRAGPVGTPPPGALAGRSP